MKQDQAGNLARRCFAIGHPAQSAGVQCDPGMRDIGVQQESHPHQCWHPSLPRLQVYRLPLPIGAPAGARHRHGQNDRGASGAGVRTGPHPAPQGHARQAEPPVRPLVRLAPLPPRSAPYAPMPAASAIGQYPGHARSECHPKQAHQSARAVRAPPPVRRREADQAIAGAPGPPLPTLHNQSIAGQDRNRGSLVDQTAGAPPSLRLPTVDTQHPVPAAPPAQPVGQLMPGWPVLSPDGSSPPRHRIARDGQAHYR